MHRIDHKSAALTMPVIAIPGPNVNGYFNYGTPTSSILPTQIQHDWLNALQENICYAIEQLGYTLDKADNTQLYVAIQQYIIIGPEGGVGLTSIQGDTDPHLGGDLIVNGHSITSATDITIEPDGTGNINLNKANIYVKTNIVHESDTGTKIAFGTDTQAFEISSSNVIDINSSGLQIKGTGARITTILDEDDMASNSATATLTQQSAKAYVDNIINLSKSKYVFLKWVNGLTSIFAGSNTDIRYMFGQQSLGANSQLISPAGLRMPKGGVVSNLKFVSTNSWSVSTIYTVTCTLFVNGVASSLTVSMTTNAGAPNVEDTTHTVSVSQGDYLELQILYNDPSFGTTTIGFSEVSIKIT